MAASAGRDLRIKYDADGGGAGAAVVIAGARTDTFTIANEMIDITDKDDNGIQTLLNDIGTQSFSLSCEGILKDDTLMLLARGAAAGSALHTFEIEFAGLTTTSIRGQWFISNFETSGAHAADATTYTFSLTSSGAMTVA